ncbi:MAG: adenylate/guanylate cyclase domain-containing protein [Rhodoferax sp.]
MNAPLDPASLTMTEIIRLQTALSQELTRRFERTMALAFTDIVESTRYFAQFGDEAGGRLQQLHFDRLEQAVTTHRGRVVDTAGDGAFVIFESAIDAANAMVQLQQLLSTENQARPREHHCKVRIGMHWGPVLTDGEVVTGDSVNLCARIAASAQPGQIRLSRELLTQLDLTQRQLCRPLPSVPLKGISRPVELLQLPWRDASRFPGQVLVHESGECLPLPSLDTLCFGRGEATQPPGIHDIQLALPDSLATRQISRRHFELHSRAEGFVLKAVSSQLTEVDGVAVPRDQEWPIGPGSIVRLARVATLEFQSTGPADREETDGTMYSPSPAKSLPGVTVFGPP